MKSALGCLMFFLCLLCWIKREQRVKSQGKFEEILCKGYSAVFQGAVLDSNMILVTH